MNSGLTKIGKGGGMRKNNLYRLFKSSRLVFGDLGSC